MELNIVYIGALSFPLGYATTKRRRYMVDYMNNNHIRCHILSTRYKKNKLLNNPVQGTYGETDYYDLSDLFYKGWLLNYYITGRRIIKEWYDDSKKNIMIFPTILNVEDFIFFRYACKLGYKIVFDKVETSYIANGTNESFKTKCYIQLCEFVSDYAYKKATGLFVISEALAKQNKFKYPRVPICLLPNSTPILLDRIKTTIGETMKILYSGTYALKDGVSFLIEGVKKAVEAGCKCELILLGKGSDRDMTFLENVKDCLYIKYWGFVSDEELYTCMKDCDILAMTRTNSKFANFGFPFKLSEYLSTGNIVLATKVSDVSLYLENRKNAYLVEPESSEQIADVLMYIDKHREEAITVAKNGFKVMQDRFSIESVGKIFISFLNSI